jgi:DNA-binding MarR family transcriptional regulator
MDQDIKSSREKQGAIGHRLEEAVRTSQTTNDMFDDALCQFLAINRTDGRCMDVVDRFGRVTAGQLATESGLTTGAVTVVIDRLEAAGYVVRIRDPLDRRKIWIETTPLVRSITEHIFGHFETLGPVLLQRFSAKQVAGIIEFLEMGSLINRELAQVLKQHIDPAANTIEARLIQARAFERAARAGAPAMKAALDALPRADVE